MEKEDKEENRFVFKDFLQDLESMIETTQEYKKIINDFSEKYNNFVNCYYENNYLKRNSEPYVDQIEDDLTTLFK